MTLRLMMDEHIPSEITERLRAAGVDVLTAQEDGSGGRSDVELLARAMQLGREIVTQDQDFLIEATRRQRAGISLCCVLFSRQHALSTGIFAEWLETYAKLEEPEHVAGRVVFIP